ncbi:MAG: General secretion pathway protein ral secretion pathway protein, partial [Candidatus Dadabacteria bacterium]|nr:General secretion pathway protein ral secretion pathway protein [Candidatus Dadabacteria bacterium]
MRGALGMKRACKVFWVSLFIIALTISIQEALPQSEDITGEKQEEVKP